MSITSFELYRRMREVDPELPAPEHVANVSLTMEPYRPAMMTLSIYVSDEIAKVVVDTFANAEIGLDAKKIEREKE